MNTNAAMVKNLCVKRVTNRAQVTSHTYATRLAAFVWLGLRAPSPRSESPAPNETDILGAARVSTTTSRAPRRENQCVNARDACDLWSAKDKRQARM